MISELRQLVEQEHSRNHADFIVQVLETKPELIPEFLELIYLEEEPLSRRAAWPFRILFDKSPNLVQPYYDEITSALENIKTPSILRCFLGIIARTKIEEKWHGFFLQYTPEIILSIQTEIAVKAYALDIFFQISKAQPDLFHELEEMIDVIYSDGSRGIQNKCRNILADIEKIRSKGFASNRSYHSRNHIRDHRHDCDHEHARVLE